MTDQSSDASKPGRSRSTLRWTSRVAALLALASCATPPPPAPPATLEVGTFWNSQTWNVERYAVSGTPKPTYYCVATTGTAQRPLGILQTAEGLTSLGVSRGPGRADGKAPGGFDVMFEPRATLRLDAAPGAPGYVVSTAGADETARDTLPRLLRQSRALTITDRQLGILGRFDLSGSSAALDELTQCARAIPTTATPPPGAAGPKPSM